MLDPDLTSEQRLYWEMQGRYDFCPSGNPFCPCGKPVEENSSRGGAELPGTL